MAEKRGRGRPPGSLNKATKEVKEAAQAFTNDALSTLAEIMRSPEHPAAARVSAANALLDRGHGRPAQALEVDATVKARVEEIRRTIVRPDNPDR